MERPWQAWGWREPDLAVADVVYERHPDWQERAVPQEWILARILSPTAGVPPLEFRLDGITVVWGAWHTEYERFPGDGEALGRAMETMEAVLDERRVLALGTRADGRLWSARLLPAPVDVAGIEEAGAPSGRIGCAGDAGPFVRWEVCSWRGSHTGVYFP